MMFAELPLSTRTLSILNPSIISIITRGSSCGCFTPLASSFENMMSLSVRLCFKGGILWILFTCLYCDFLRDLNNPPVDGPSVIIFISPIALCEQWDVWSSSLGEASCLSLLLFLDLPESPFFTNFFNFPLRMSSSICSSGLCNLLFSGSYLCGNGSIFFCHVH